MPNQPAFSPRPGGGFNPGMGQLNEHMDQQAMTTAMQQKGMNQQAGQAAAAPGAMPGLPNSDALSGGVTPATPREVGTLTEELVTRPAHDVAEGLLSIIDLNNILGLPQTPEDPATEQKKQVILQNYNQKTQEVQTIAKQRYQEDIKRKQLEEENKARQAQAAQQRPQLVMPSSPQKGPVGPGGSNKQKAMTKLENDRQTLSGPASAN
jgi:hypothetical protein